MENNKNVPNHQAVMFFKCPAGDLFTPRSPPWSRRSGLGKPVTCWPPAMTAQKIM